MNPIKIDEPSGPPRSARLDGIHVHSLVSGCLIAHPRLSWAATSSRRQSVEEKQSSLDRALRRGRLEISQNRSLMDGRL